LAPESLPLSGGNKCRAWVSYQILAGAGHAAVMQVMAPLQAQYPKSLPLTSSIIPIANFPFVSQWQLFKRFFHHTKSALPELKYASSGISVGFPVLVAVDDTVSEQTLM
jgi:hypothetical protein